MKKVIYILSLIVSSIAFAAPDFIEIRSIKSSYQIGDRPVYLITQMLKPNDVNTEVFIEAKLQGVPIKVVKISESQWGVVSSSLANLGPLTFEAKVYLQNKNSALSKKIAVEKNLREVEDLLQAKRKAKDPQRIAILESAISEKNQESVLLEEQLAKGRTLIETQSMVIPVSSMLKKNTTLVNPAALVFNVNEPYVEGRNKFLSVSVNQNGVPEIGSFKTEVVVKIDGVEKVKGRNQSYVYLDFSALQRGTYSFTAELFLRDKFVADILEEAIGSASITRLNTLPQLRNEAISNDLKLYYDKEIEDVTLISQALDSVFEDIKINFYSTSKSIAVLAPPLVFSTLAANTNHSCGIVSGKLYCWGKNEHGELGVGDNLPRLIPTEVNGMSSGVTEVQVGLNHTCAIKSNTLYCWGDNTFGQLGNGLNSSTYLPVQVSGLPTLYGSISLGSHHSCVITSGGTYCWGRNSHGQLGIGSLTDSNIPVLVLTPSLVTWGGLTSGDSFTCAFRPGGGLGGPGFAYCWGSNEYGQLGLSGGGTYSTPVNSDVGTYKAKGDTICIYSLHWSCRGNNSYGQFGLGLTNSTHVFVYIPGPYEGYGNLVLGKNSICYTNYSQAYCAGKGVDGGLGNNGNSNSSVFVAQPYYPNSISRMEIGDGYGLAQVTDDYLMSWGANRGGNLGNGTSDVHNLTPKPVNAPLTLHSFKY
ncbi:hypothetical protein AZI85_08545 [Bdellovibrio bacteriovorus]|uniref:Uncharacterized protein n=1 Tax=Bdellovibrio bacteriovorus TaxID=959 RepID=A0A150WDN7_BDEBC|nr:hypothetical protein [Bdellovibrio bacteriovorus]KYG61000.1 hypothetical protein AZI85_08545 [Bdellovibrio bacteriovorus]